MAVNFELLTEKQLIMKTSDNNRNRLPEWQSARMRSLIEERWSEVWEIVVARERSSQDAASNS